ncbi:MAG: hypothetical protein ABUL72_01430, partial [Armatimonadota bacterium]
YTLRHGKHMENGVKYHAFSDANYLGATYEDQLKKDGLGKVGLMQAYEIQKKVKEWAHQGTYSDGGDAARQQINDRVKADLAALPSFGHALPDVGGLVGLGKLLHYQQDYYSHRHVDTNDNDDLKFRPYASLGGHGIEDGSDPDLFALRPELGELALRHTLNVLIGAKPYVLAGPPSDGVASMEGSPLAETVARKLAPSIAQSYPVRDSKPDFPDQATVSQAIRDCIRQYFATRIEAGFSVPTYGRRLIIPYDKPEQVETKAKLLLAVKE